MKLYFIELTRKEKIINLLDYTPSNENDLSAHDAIDKHLEEKKDKERQMYERKLKNAADKEQEKREKMRETQKKEYEEYQKKNPKKSTVSDNKSRIDQLAQPKDKWKVGKKLMELAAKFPHDRVLQRMVKEEFKSNQAFRYMEEYDVFNETEETNFKL